MSAAPSSAPASLAVCFVCLGNICRSPQAEALFRRKVAEAGLQARVVVDSAGTSANHVGEAPDRRTAAASARRGVPVTGAARQFEVRDFDRFDYIVAMDASNLRNVVRLARSEADRAKVSLLRSWDATADGPDVPDPWYGGPEGFDAVFEICDAGCSGLADALFARLAPRR